MALKDIVAKIRSNQDGYDISNIKKAADLLHDGCDKSYFMQDNKPHFKIVKFVKDLGFDIYVVSAEKMMLGVIVGDEIKNRLRGSDKVIMINKRLPEESKRFVLACALGYYIFDFCNNLNIMEYYMKLPRENDEIIDKDHVITDFAMYLLLPDYLFNKSYNRACKQYGDDQYEIVSTLSYEYNVPMSLIVRKIESK